MEQVKAILTPFIQGLLKGEGNQLANELAELYGKQVRLTKRVPEAHGAFTGEIKVFFYRLGEDLKRVFKPKYI